MTDQPLPNLNRLAKWRTLLAGWQLGTRPKGDPESDAVRDHREATLIQRAELSALASMLIDRGVFTGDEFAAAIEHEADMLSMQMEARFPGIRATDSGLEIDPARAVKTMKGWRP
jgi:hypothetical protein